MFRRTKLTVLAFVAPLIALNACTIEDEGATDYRRAPLQSSTTALKQPLTQLTGKYGPEPDSTAARIKTGEYYQITLKQGVIKHMVVLPALGNLRFDPDGEVAVVANVFEVSKGTSKISFGPAASQQAKVIYYSSDVFKGQYLNLSQLPIYGPVKYEEGNMVVVQLIGLEIDQVDDRTNNLLKQLANLGAGAASGYNPLAGEAASVLTDLALAFLNGSNNDVIFFYTFTLAQEQPSRYVPQDHLTEGERVLVRLDDRHADFDWSKVALDRATGRLLNSDSSEYRDNTYMVVDITRTKPDLTAAEHQTLDSLLKEIRTSQPQSTDELERIGDLAKELSRSNYVRKLLDPRFAVISDPIATSGERRAEVFNLMRDIHADLKRSEGARQFGVSGIAAALEKLRALALKGDKDFDQSALTEDAIRANEDINALARSVSDAIERAFVPSG